MKVLVTGATGRVGRWVVRLLLEKGYEVTGCGRKPEAELSGAHYVALDVTDADAVAALVAQHERVIHLAAIASPGWAPETKLFEINVAGTYNVYAACAAAGINRVAVASSINALGQFYGCKPLPVRYFPIDEDHPQLLSDEYSLSKHMTEELASYFWHKAGVSSVCLRIPGVLEPIEEHAARVRRSRERGPEAWARNYWCAIDARDSARAFVAGIEAEYEGPHRLFVNDDRNIVGLPSRELAAKVYPEVSEWRAPVSDDESLVSCERARRVLGWTPAFSWRGVAAGGPLP